MKINPIRQKIYKVVFAEGGRLYSWQCGALNRFGLGIKYLPNQIVRGRVGRLFAFDNENSAIEYDSYNNRENKQVWEGWGYGVSPLKSRLQFGHFEIVDKFWELNLFSESRFSYKDYNNDTITGCASNTVGCKSIKLLKRIK
jgi:hypothetical protein